MKVAKLNGKLLTNIKSKTILGGNTQEKIVTPSTERQVITADSGYTCLDKVNVEAVTSAIDSNIKPENIKKDISILGVTGTLESVPVPTKSWLYITEWDSNGYPIKAKTIGCSGNMPYDYMYGDDSGSYINVLTKYLKEFEINEGVTSIGSFAFAYCTNLTNIKIPDSVISISTFAFANCSNLVSIYIPDGVTNINERTFKSCSKLTSIILPDSIKNIYYEGFVSCSNLQNIKLSSNLERIDNQSFRYCYKLSLFDFRGATRVPALMGTNAFESTPSTKKIVVPDALYDEWITATNWSSSSYNIVSSIIKASDYEASL